MNHLSNNNPPTQPRNGNNHKFSKRELLSMTMLLISLGALGISLIGGARLIMDVFSSGLAKSLGSIGAKAIVVGLAYTVGWVTAIVAIRVYGNLILPMLINWFTWGCLAGVCFLYILILQRLYAQGYDWLHFWAYLSTIAAGLGAMVGLHLIIEDHDLRPLAIPLLMLTLIELGMIVFRYVFTTGADPAYLSRDLFFFFFMAAFSILMLVHLGILEPLRIQFANYFDKSSKALRSKD